MALAAVVDDATSSVDNIARRLRDGPRRTCDDEPAPARRASIARRGAATTRARSAGLRAGGHGRGARCRSSSLEGLAGDSFYPPLAISFLIAVVVSLLVAADASPRLSASCCSRRAAGEPDSPVVRGLQRRATTALLAPSVGIRWLPSIGGVRWSCSAWASSPAPQLDRSVLPPSRRPICSSAGTARRAPRCRRWTASPAGRPRSCAGSSRRPQRRTPTSAGPSHGDQVGGANTGEIWVSFDPGAPTTTPPSAAIEERRQRLPRPRPQGADVLAEPHERGAGARADAGPRPALRPGPRRPAGEGRRVGQVLSGIDGAQRRATSSAS